MMDALKKLEGRMGKKLGDVSNPLLVSVRSGAKFSMPGMMDTILNLGLNDETVKDVEAKTNNPRFAYDCYRRFIQMYGNVVQPRPERRNRQIVRSQDQQPALRLRLLPPFHPDVRQRGSRSPQARFRRGFRRL